MLVKDFFNVIAPKRTNKDVGFELEVEGNNLLNEVAGFDVTRDGSLRGDNREYVFKRPSTQRNAKLLIKRLCKELNKECEILDTGRAGTHVHVNVQNLSMKELLNYITLYAVMEEVLVAYCGENREGNHFCLRLIDAQFTVDTIRRGLREGHQVILREWGSDLVRYSALNLQALQKYGSLEFRTMRSTTDSDVLIKWMEILLHLREEAKKYVNPQEIIQEFSEGGGEAFLINHLGDHSNWFINNLEDLDARLMSGMRIAQDIAYAIDWNGNVFDREQRPHQVGYKFAALDI